MYSNQIKAFTNDDITQKYPFKSKQQAIRKKPKAKTFQEFFQVRSKCFSINDRIKTLKTSAGNFIDQQFVDAIDQKTSNKRMTQFIKRKVPLSTKIRTEPIQVIKDPSFLQNKKNLNIFSSTFNRQRNKFLSKFQTSKQLKDNLLQKLGMKKKKEKLFFQMQRKHIFSFENQYHDLFKRFNTKQKNRQKSKLNKEHPFSKIYKDEAKKVLRSFSFEKKKQVDFKPFGQIDYSAHY